MRSGDFRRSAAPLVGPRPMIETGTHPATRLRTMALQNRLALLLVTTVVAAASGYVPAAEPPTPVAAVTPIPPALAEHTYVYILDGVNPLGLAGVKRLADRLQRAGFVRTRAGGWYSGDGFEREIRATHAADPSARFAVIGYSAGSYTARALANRLVQSGVPVAVIGYIGGDYLRDTSETRVPGAGRVVNITGDGYLLTGRNLMFNGTESIRSVERPAERDVALRPANTSAYVRHAVLSPGGGRQVIGSIGKQHCPIRKS